ncbi:MAG: hypothetical protein RI884_1420 [Pseudomonadota bacterium]|jgi:hypothetical protein
MAYSSIMGADKAPAQPSGRGSDMLGPSDNSDSGSDARGTEEVHGDSDSTGTGERGVVSGVDGKEGVDILPDRVVRLGPDGNLGDAGPDTGLLDEDQEYTDLDDNPDAADDEDRC